MGIKIEEFELPHIDSGPYGITAGKDGALWFTQHKANQIGRMTVDGKVTHIDRSYTQCRCAIYHSTTQGDVWFTENRANKIGKLTVTGEIIEYTLPNPEFSTFWNHGRTQWRHLVYRNEWK